MVGYGKVNYNITGGNKMLNLSKYSSLEIACNPTLSKLSEQQKQLRKEELTRMQKEGLKEFANPAKEIEQELKNWF